MALKKISFYPGDIPTKPGVYIYRDSFGTVIYVCKASNLRRRMSQYFQPSRETRADPKLRSLINSIDSWECITVRNEDEALILRSWHVYGRMIPAFTSGLSRMVRRSGRLWSSLCVIIPCVPALSMIRARRNIRTVSLR